MDVRLKPLPWAKSLLRDTKSSVTAVTAGLGAGKTHAGFQWHLLRCLLNRNSPNSAVLYPTFAECRQIGQERYHETLQEAGFKEGRDYQIFTSQIDPRIELSILGHCIRFLSGDNPRRLRAAEYSHMYADEVADLDEDVYSMARSRVRCRRAAHLQSLWTGVPQGLTWFADEFDSDTQEGWTKPTATDHYCDRYIEEFDTTLRFRRIRVRTDDNPYLPDSYVAELIEEFGHNENLLRAYRHGIFCPLFTGLAYTFSEVRHVETHEAVKELPIELCWDFNIELVWTALQVHTFRDDFKSQNKYIATNECPSGCDAFDDAIFAVTEQFPPYLWKDTPIHIYGDRSGYARRAHEKAPITDYQWIIRDLRKFYNQVHLRAAEVVAPQIASVESVNKVFSRRQFLIHPRCRELIRGYQRTQWKKHKKELDKPMGENWTHRPDGVKYRIYQGEVLDRLSDKPRRRGINI